ncbi:uncharacterized protein TNCV_376241 [Trichonephila clavipes]|nr:uncharacterized protein TNCV_376241 [Trichonephila clavipes]
MHYWSFENPHLIRPNHHQVRWSVNVWCGIWRSTLIGPIFFDGPLTSESYTEILSGPLADFLEDEVSLRDLSCMWYQHDGVPAHKSAQPCRSQVSRPSRIQPVNQRCVSFTDSAADNYYPTSRSIQGRYPPVPQGNSRERAFNFQGSQNAGALRHNRENEDLNFRGERQF